MSAKRPRPRVEVAGRLPDNPQRLITSEHVRVAGGIDEYATKLREWWNHPRHDADVQREARTGIILAIVKTLCNGRDSDWAAAVPQGLTQAAGRAAGKQQARAMVRGDEVSRERLRLLLTQALTARLSTAERDAACDALWLPQAPTGDGDEENIVTMRELMGPILSEVTAECRAAVARADCAQQLAREFGGGIDPEALLPLRLTLVNAYVAAGDARGARRWMNFVHRDWYPPPLQAEVARLRIWESGGKSAQHFKDAHPIPPEDIPPTFAGYGTDDYTVEEGIAGLPTFGPRAGYGRTPLPPHLLTAGALAVDGWGASSFGKGKGRHGAVVIGADGVAELGRGSNAAEVPGTSTAGVACGGANGKFVVHAEMVAVRSALEAAGGDLGVLRNGTVYVARLATRGEHYEDAAPCEMCEGVLRACGLAKAVHTRTCGKVGEVTLVDGGGEAKVGLSEAHCRWMGVSSAWATAP